MLTRLFRRRRGEEGFTLIELLVVVAIIALLTAFAVPSLYQAMNKSKQGKDKVALDTISGAVERQYVDNTAYPTVQTTFETDLTTNYIKNSTTKVVNSFGYPFIYITNATGDFYILVDPQNNASLDVQCNGVAATTATISLTKQTAAPYTFKWVADSGLTAANRHDCVAGHGTTTFVPDKNIPVFTSF